MNHRSDFVHWTTHNICISPIHLSFSFLLSKCLRPDFYSNSGHVCLVTGNQISGLANLTARSGMSIVKVLDTYHAFQCWKNQLSGLATHHAHPPLTPINIMIHLCLSLKSGLVNLLLYCFSMLKSYIRSCRLDLSLTSLILLPPICTLRARDVYLQNIGYQVLYASFFPCSLPQRKHLMYFKIFIEFYIEIRYQVL